jgi:hypothetical protein
VGGIIRNCCVVGCSMGGGGGDINTIRYPTERVGAYHFVSNMRDFLAFINSLGLIDLPLEGGSFTWSNSRSKSRLDRFLFSTSLEEHFSKMVQQCLLRLLSDHFPILLSCVFMQRGKNPLRFENMWLKEEGFHERVKGW